MKTMKKNPYPGKFVVLDGLDGSGKATQTKLLVERLKKEDVAVKKIDFPQYGTKSAGMVENYLNGKYGDAKEVGPYVSSIFFACDRYDASLRMKDWLEAGHFLVADRYVSASIGHQGGKIDDNKKRAEFIKWVYSLEFDIFKIPRPDVTFILKTSPEIACEMSSKISDSEKVEKRKAYLGKSEKKDIHERDLGHLKDALMAYTETAGEFPDDFEIIECLKDGRFLPRSVIHEKIWKIIKLRFKL